MVAVEPGGETRPSREGVVDVLALGASGRANQRAGTATALARPNMHSFPRIHRRSMTRFVDKTHTSRFFLAMKAMRHMNTILRGSFGVKLGRVALATLCSLTLAGAARHSTAAAASSITVNMSAASWFLQGIPIQQAAATYHKLHPNITINIQQDTPDWSTKVLAQLKSNGTSPWDVHFVTTPFQELDADIAQGIIQPFDPYLKASTEPGARQLKSAMIPSVLADGSRNGKLYSLAYSAEIVGLEWRTDLAAKVGITTPPATWNQLKADLVKLATNLHGKNAVTITSAPVLHDLQEAWVMSASKHPFTKDGLIDWLSPEAQQALVFMKQLTQLKGTDKGLDTGGDALWQAGFSDFTVAPDSRAGWIGKAGLGSAAFVPLPTRCAGCGSGQVFWGNGMSLLKGAQQPQAATDFLVWAFGPDDSAGMAVHALQADETPVYTAYLHKIKTDPSLASQRWQLPVINLIANSLPQASTLYWMQENQAAQKYWPQYVNTNMTALQYAKSVTADVAASIQRSKG